VRIEIQRFHPSIDIKEYNNDPILIIYNNVSREFGVTPNNHFEPLYIMDPYWLNFCTFIDINDARSTAKPLMQTPIQIFPHNLDQNSELNLDSDSQLLYGELTKLSNSSDCSSSQTLLDEQSELSDNLIDSPYNNYKSPSKFIFDNSLIDDLSCCIEKLPESLRFESCYQKLIKGDFLNAVEVVFYKDTSRLIYKKEYEKNEPFLIR